MDLEQNENKGRLKVLVLLNLPIGNLRRPAPDGFQASLHFSGFWKTVPPWGRVNILLASTVVRRQEISRVFLKLLL
jgi:hypothetical protein